MTSQAAELTTPELDSPRGFHGNARSTHVRNLLARSTVAGSTNGLTPEIVRKMRRHYQVASCLLVHSLPLIRADWSIECEDEEIRDRLTIAYRAIAFDVHRSMARALWAGLSPNTLTWTYREDVRIIFPGEILDLDPKTCSPAVDESGRFAGIVQRAPGVPDDAFDPIYCLLVVEGMESGNLYGRSILDAALDPWADYAAIRAFHARYLERFGEPVVIARAPSGKTLRNAAQIQAVVDANAAAGLAEGQAGYVTPPAPILEDNLDTALAMGTELRHHSVVALPSSLLFGADGKATGYAWQLDFLESKGGAGGDFLEAIRETDKRIARALFVPDLLISNGQDSGGAARSLGESHRTVWSEAVEGRLDDYSRQITAQLIDPARRLNFGDGSAPARLVFSPLADEQRARTWALVEALVTTGRLPVDGAALAAEAGLPLLEDDGADAAGGSAEAKLASSPFSSVGLPALISSGIITRQEGRDLLRLGGLVPPTVDLPAKAGAGEELSADERATVRLSLGLPADPPDPRPVVELAAPHAAHGLALDPYAGLPPWKLPQSYDPPPYRRALNAREERVGFAALESGLNTREDATTRALVELLDGEHDRILRQLTGIIRKGSEAEVLAGLGTLEIKGTGTVAKAWADLMGDVGTLAVERLREELADYANLLPLDVGPAGRAAFRAYATTSAERATASLLTEVRLGLLNAYTSGVTTRPGMAAIVAQTFDAYQSSEGKPIRLTTRMLSAKALNYSRADAIQRGGVPLAGAQYSAILDRRTCELCEDLDERVIAIESTDLARFTPPVHHNCRCVWVWITRDEPDFTPTWVTPAPSKVDRFGGLVL